MKYVLVMISIALLAAGCSDGGGSSQSAPTSVTLKAGECNVIQSGDTLEELEEGTVVEITHDLDGSRSVCISSGEALLTFATAD